MMENGCFKDLDIAIASHATQDTCAVSGPSYAQFTFKVEITGKSSHAAMAPELGINALQAAVNAINNVNAMRETLPQAKNPRIHYIITKGGDSPNIIPDDVRMEFGVRANSAEYLMELNDMVNRAIRAGAMTVGAGVEIEDLGAYQPTYQDKNLSRLFAENAEAIFGESSVIDASDLFRGSSTDVGEVAALVPTIHTNFDGNSDR